VTKRWHGAFVVVAGVGALVSAIVLYGHRGYHTPADAGVVPATAKPASTINTALHGPVPGTQTTRHHQAKPLRGWRPTRVALSSIHLDAPVVGVGVHDGALDVPQDAKVLGWWSAGARAGASAGSVVLVGHVDVQSIGPGALFRLESVPMGAQAVVTTPNGSVTYTIVGRRVYEKQSLPSSVFDTHGTPRLVLITCGGPYDPKTQHYADNVVVYGVPVTG
jgi:hypothetical protein